jgi:O-antigen/teichoic acid export membrane protein
MIARKSLLIVISNYLVQFIGLIGLAVLAKLWGGFAPEALGIIGFAMSFLALFNIIADLGFSQAHVKRVSEGKDLGTCIGTYAAIKIFLTCLMVIVVLVSLFIWKTFFHGGFTDATTESIIFVFLIYYIFTNLLAIPLNTFTGTREIAKRQVLAIFGRIVKVPLVILVALAGANAVILGGNLTNISPVIQWPEFLQPVQQFFADHAVGSLAVTYVIDTMVAFSIGIWFLRRYTWKKPNWALFKSYFSFALPIMLTSFIGIISVNIDKIMIGYFWTSTEVGYYFTMQRVYEILSILSGAVGVVLFPTISKYHSSKNFQKTKNTTHLAERYISMILVPPAIVIIIFAKPVIEIMLDSAFLPAVPVLIVLSIYVFIIGVASPYAIFINGINRPDVTVKIGVVICAINISLNCLFIPERGLLSPFGINGPTGAAIATVLSSLVGFFGLRLAAKKLTGIKLLQSHTPRHIMAGLVMGGILYYIAYQTSLFPTIRWYTLFGFAGIGLAVYLVVLFVLMEFKKQDLLFFLDLLHLKKMLNYIKSEVKEK